MQGLIVEHTERVAAELARKYAADPEAEIETWLAIAQEREAMVVELYAGGALARRLPILAEARTPLARVVQKTIGGIWAQESSHTTLMRAFRIVDDQRLSAIRTFLGAAQGRMTDWATKQGPLGPVARWLVGIGRAAGAAPEFTVFLDALTLGGFFTFSAELEETAHRGYSRILQLLDLLEANDIPLKYGPAARYDFAKTAAEERFHRAVFDCLMAWLTADGADFTAREPAEAVAELRRIADRTLALSRVEGLSDELRTRSAMRGSDGTPEELVSNGGLGELFEEFSFETHVAPPPP